MQLSSYQPFKARTTLAERQLRVAADIVAGNHHPCISQPATSYPLPTIHTSLAIYPLQAPYPQQDDLIMYQLGRIRNSTLLSMHTDTVVGNTRNAHFHSLLTLFILSYHFTRISTISNNVLPRRSWSPIHDIDILFRVFVLILFSGSLYSPASFYEIIKEI